MIVLDICAEEIFSPIHKSAINQLLFTEQKVGLDKAYVQSVTHGAKRV